MSQPSCLKPPVERREFGIATLSCAQPAHPLTLTCPFKSLWKIKALSQQIKSQVTFTILLDECKGYESNKHAAFVLFFLVLFFYMVPRHVACKPVFPDVI